MRNFTKNLLWRVAALTMILGACSSINAWAKSYFIYGGASGESWSQWVELTDNDGDGYYTSVYTTTTATAFKVVYNDGTKDNYYTIDGYWWSKEKINNKTTETGLSTSGNDMFIGGDPNNDWYKENKDACDYNGYLVFVLTVNNDGTPASLQLRPQVTVNINGGFENDKSWSSKSTTETPDGSGIFTATIATTREWTPIKLTIDEVWCGFNKISDSQSFNFEDNTNPTTESYVNNGGDNAYLKFQGSWSFIININTQKATAQFANTSFLADILSNGTNETTYSISDDLAIVTITEDGSRAYATDGSNWVALELGSFSSAVSSHNGGIKGGTIVGTLSNRDTKPTITLTSIDLSDAVTPPSYSIANLDLTSSTFTAPKPCQLVNVVGYPNGGKLYGWGHHNESTHYINLATDYLSTAPSFTTDAKTTLENVAIELGEAISASAPRRAPASDYSNVTGQLTSPTMNVVTAVEDVNASKTVAGVKYYNLMGVESNQPFDGVNIIVTRYTDGTSQAVKVVK